MPNRILFALVSLIGLAGFTFGIYNYINQPRIAYVRSHDLVYSYEGTKEARAKFDAKKEGWQANIDTLSTDLQRAITKFNAGGNSMNKMEKEDMQKYLQTQQQQLVDYSRAIEQKAQEEDEKMMQSVLNQVNSFVEEYGKKNGYEVILGTTLSGNLLYGEKSMDITDELLSNLNEHYKGKK